MTNTSLFNTWITRPNPSLRAKIRLFCFSHAGGSASSFSSWSTSLPLEIEVCPVQLPGRENRFREAPFTQLSPLVQTLSQVILPYLNLPFAFFGHSMGALIGFELARELRRQYRKGPVHLFVSGYRAPHLPDPDPPIHQLPESLFLEELRNLHGTPEQILQNAELMQIMLPFLRADFAVCETYAHIHEYPLDCPISAFGGREDSQLSYDELIAWRDQTSSSFSLRMVPGNHFFLLNAQAHLWQAVLHDLMLSMNQTSKGQR
jgi:surfactin synthase thioesterase subunit